MVSQNKAFCNNAGLHCSCSQAVNSVRELIWLQKSQEQMPWYFLRLGKFANSIQKDPQHTEETATAPDLSFFSAQRNYTLSEPGFLCQSRLEENPLSPDCPHLSCVLMGWCRQQAESSMAWGEREATSAQQLQGCHFRGISFKGNFN